MRSVNINCLVLGKPFRNIISIKIKENETNWRTQKAEKDYFETVDAKGILVITCKEDKGVMKNLTKLRVFLFFML
ncbi:uncharacterized protein OCT59_022149 [Rhizophagus irregularis]|uniref:uncharacterized protein n=1 Tax=Rhizophagus irregularis TaxID=588596 RepID=UPI00332F90A3|nr:hypothetical protein OCT59_022149 [Rhizophagus irregularis]